MNILLITSDQQHWKTLGCQNPEIHTPHLDRLAREGMLFERAYCPNPTCTPTRASLITGMYPSQHGAYSLGTKLDERVPVIGDEFHSAGFDTSLIGKAHFQPLASTPEYPSLESYPVLQDLDFWREYRGPFYGFRNFELARNHTDEPHVGQHYAIWMEEKGAGDWRRWFAPPTGTTPSQRGRWNIPEKFHYNEWITERSITRLETMAETPQPFFHWASFFDPHPSYLVPEPWASMYDPAKLTIPAVAPDEHGKNPRHFQLSQEADPDFSEWAEEGGDLIHGFHCHLQDPVELAKDVAIYYGMTSYLDASVGRILEALDRLGLAEETLVVFTSDHGHLFGQHGLIAKGAFHYEDLLRVPMIARLPGRIPASVRSSAIQSLVDLPATFLDYAGLPIPRTMTGRNQRNVWEGRAASARDHALVENRHQPRRLSLRTLVTEDAKITIYEEQEDGELFDLVNDPSETKNLWTDPSAASLKERMLHKLAQSLLSAEPVPMPRISRA